MPLALPTAALGLTAALTAAAAFPLASTAWLRVTGADRVRWMNGMVTNSIGTLPPGTGSYNFVLNAQGRIQGDLNCFTAPNGDSLLLETGQAQIPTLLALFDRFIIMDEVELAEDLPVLQGLLLAGPAAADLLRQLGLEAPGVDDAALSLADRHTPAGNVRIVRAFSPVVPRFELWAEPPTLARLAASLTAAEIPTLGPAELEQLRLLEGRPAFGVEIRERELPQETALPGAPSRALHFAKGCYLGQEIVERIRSRGNLHRTLAGFILSGQPPALPAPLTAGADAKAAGELTSAAAVTLPDGSCITLALGYIRREALEAAPTAPLAYPGGTATPAALPWRVVPPPSASQ